MRSLPTQTNNKKKVGKKRGKAEAAFPLRRSRGQGRARLPPPRAVSTVTPAPPLPPEPGETRPGCPGAAGPCGARCDSGWVPLADPRCRSGSRRSACPRSEYPGAGGLRARIPSEGAGETRPGAGGSSRAKRPLRKTGQMLILFARSLCTKGSSLLRPAVGTPWLVFPSRRKASQVRLQ